MRKIFFFLTIILSLFSLNYAESQQRKAIYFDKLPDEYSPSYIPENIIPPNAKKDRYKVPDNQGGSSGGLLKYEWEELDPNGNKCFVKLRYTRHSYSSTGHLSNIPYEDVRPISPEEKAYIYSLVWTDQCLTLEPQKAVAVEIQGIPQQHLPYNYPNDPNGAKKIISDLRKSNSIPIGYVIFQCNNNSYNFSASYGNISLDADISCSRLDYKRLPIPEFMKERVKQIGLAAYSRLTGNPSMVEKPIEQPKETQREQPKKESIPVKATVMPSAIGDEQSSTAYLPASKELPARITAETKPNTKVTFQILKSDGTAYLRVKGQQADTVQVVSDSKGIAKALFYYNGGKVSSPKKYEIKVTTREEPDLVTVYVGLGLTFSRISAAQGAYGEKHPFVLSVRSTFFPNLPLAVYLSNASEKVWHGFNVGVRLRPEWVNKPANLPPDKVFTGITKITATPVGATSDNVLTVISYSMLDETVYAHTRYAYPAIKMQSDGYHSYRILGELVLTDKTGKDYGKIDEDMILDSALTIISKEEPESFIERLACSFEPTTVNQFLFLTAIKSIPVIGEPPHLMTTITSVICKFSKGDDYESIFLEVASYLGRRYLDYLFEPPVFNRLTPKQQNAFLAAYFTYIQLEAWRDNKDYERLKEIERRRGSI